MAYIGDGVMSPPLFATRTLYAPGHFGNSYEVVGDNEFRTLLTAWQSWGFNEYADWLIRQIVPIPMSNRFTIWARHCGMPRNAGL